MVIPIRIGTLGMYPKSLGRGAGRVRNQKMNQDQTTALLRLTRILKRVLKT